MAVQGIFLLCNYFHLSLEDNCLTTIEREPKPLTSPCMFLCLTLDEHAVLSTVTIYYLLASGYFADGREKLLMQHTQRIGSSLSRCSNTETFV